MAFTFDPIDPSQMTVEQRMEELTSILAAGFRRLRCRDAVVTPSAPSEVSLDSAQIGLDDFAETRLHGHQS